MHTYCYEVHTTIAAQVSNESTDLGNDSPSIKEETTTVDDLSVVCILSLLWSRDANLTNFFL